MYTLAMQEDSIRIRILDAAARRFTDYGYGKTTIAEIAGDCGMSSGNVYRYFESKEAIAIAGVQQKLEEKSIACETATDTLLPAIEQLRQYLFARLRFTHAFSCGGSHLHELVQLITERHRDVLNRYDERAIDWLEAIVQRGIERGEFRGQPARRSAASIFMASIMFCVPIFMHEPLDVLEERLQAVIDLLHEGLRV